jgi:ribosome biogenesis GTPase
LTALGWDEDWAEAFAPFAKDGLVPGRVIREHRGRYRVMTEGGEVVGTASGRMRLDAVGKSDLPGVGDWVALRPPSADGRAYVQGVVPRRSAFKPVVHGTANERDGGEPD